MSGTIACLLAGAWFLQYLALVKAAPSTAVGCRTLLALAITRRAVIVPSSAARHVNVLDASPGLAEL
jgi:hypothetical protein